MEVILMQDVPNLGHIGELVKVKPGYGRNFLLPKKLALPASSKNKKQLEHQQKVASFKQKKAKAESEAVAKQLGGQTITIARKVGENDKLFGSVTSQDIAAALSEKGIKVERRKVVLPEPIRQLGETTVTVKLRPDVSAQVKVQVVAEASAAQ